MRNARAHKLQWSSPTVHSSTVVKRNWAKQRTNYQAMKDWNDLDCNIRNALTLTSFKKSIFLNF